MSRAPRPRRWFAASSRTAATALVLLAAATSAVAVGGSAAALTVTSQRLTVLRTCTLTAYPTTANVEADATVDQSDPTANSGTATTLVVASRATGSANGERNQRVYVRFDPGACVDPPPGTAVIAAAWLRLYVTELPETCRTYDVFPVAASWSETAITWSNQPAGASIDSPPSAARTAAATAGAATGCGLTTNDAYLGWDVTADVAAFLTGSAVNHGWEIRDDAESPAGTPQNFVITTAAREAGVPANAPQLEITWR